MTANRSPFLPGPAGPPASDHPAAVVNAIHSFRGVYSDEIRRVAARIICRLDGHDPDAWGPPTPNGYDTTGFFRRRTWLVIYLADPRVGTLYRGLMAQAIREALIEWGCNPDEWIDEMGDIIHRAHRPVLTHGA